MRIGITLEKEKNQKQQKAELEAKLEAELYKALKDGLKTTVDMALAEILKEFQ